MKKFYDVPTQVKFENPDATDGWSYGIAYGDCIICGCCGGVFPIEELNEDGIAIESYEAHWKDITKAIKGE